MLYDNRDLIDIENTEIGILGFTINKYQKRVLSILSEIDRVCKKNNIEWFLGYGTLIGAVRHQGFIPWDDDVDIIMTRENYNKFYEACKKDLSNDYDLTDAREDNGGCYLFSRVREKNSTYIIKSEISNYSRNAGIYVDVFILDYYSKNKLVREIQRKSLLYVHRVVSPGFSQGVQHISMFESGILKLMKTILGKKLLLNLLYKGVSCAKAENTDEVYDNFIIGSREKILTMKKYHFEKSIRVKFENLYLPIPFNSLTLLNTRYCRFFIDENIDLDINCDSEEDYIKKQNFNEFVDIMYIPRERQRDSHLEVIFDPDKNSNFYTNEYLKVFDKKKNDKAAIKERFYRERSMKYLDILNKNSISVQKQCNKILLKQFVEQYVNSQKNIDYTFCGETLGKLGIVENDFLSFDEELKCIDIFIKSGYLVWAKRLIKKIKSIDSNNIERIKEKEVIVDNFMNSFYESVYSDKVDLISKIIEKYDENEYALIRAYKCVFAFRNKKYDEAINIYKQEKNKSKNLLIPMLLEYGNFLADNNRNIEAIDVYTEALNQTLYWPILKIIIDKIKKCREVSEFE